jgi:hypothetical protein
VFQITILFQALLFCYCIITSFVPLGRFTGVKNTPFSRRLVETLLNGSMFALPVVLSYYNYRESIFVYIALVVGEYLSWWHPYIFGPSAHWRAHYDRYYANTLLAPLPRFKNRPVPNLEHALLHLGTVIALILTWQTIK